MYSKVLCNANSIPVVPEIAELYGPKEAMFLQQIHYWIQHKMNHPHEYEKSELGGYYWFYGTFKNLADKYPVFGCERTIRRMVDRLVKEKVLIAFKPYKDEGDHTYWYRIDDDLLFEKYEQRRQDNLQRRVAKSRQKPYLPTDKMSEPMDKVSKGSDNLSMPGDKMSEPSDKMSDSYTKTSTKTTTETSHREEMIDSDIPPQNTDALEPDKSGMPDEVKKSGEKFWKGYKRIKGKGSKKDFLARWAKLSEQKRVHAQELHDKLCFYMPEWRNGEEGCPWPENFLKPKYLENEIDFDALATQFGNAQQSRSAPGPVETAETTLTYTNGQWREDVTREQQTESEEDRKARELVAKAFSGEI